MIQLDLTPVVQMFSPCCFNLCFDCFCVQIRKGFTCSVQFNVRTSKNKSLPCVTQGYSCHLRTVQNKQVVECFAQASEVVSKMEVDILWTQFVQVCNDVIHGAMVEIKQPFSQPILVRLGTGSAFKIGNNANGRQANSLDITVLSLLRHLTGRKCK